MPLARVIVPVTEPFVRIRRAVVSRVLGSKYLDCVSLISPSTAGRSSPAPIPPLHGGCPIRALRSVIIMSCMPFSITLNSGSDVVQRWTQSIG
jgi:hypothetical protein